MTPSIEPSSSPAPSPRAAPSRGLPRVAWLRAAAAAAVVAALALAFPLLWTAAAAGAGLLVLGGLGLLGAAALRALPLLGQRLEHRLLAARKAEARKNPLEQLETFLLARGVQVAAVKQQVGTVGAQLRALEDLLADRRREKPSIDLERQERSLTEMRQAHALLLARYLDAERALGELRGAVEDKRFEWRFGQAGQSALRSLGKTTGDDLLEQLLADEAFGSARDEFNRVFADLEVEARRLERPPSIPTGEIPRAPALDGAPPQGRAGGRP